eukprot:s5612_g5.t1
MRVKRSVDCLLSAVQGSDGPHRAKLRMAGLSSAVTWLPRARPGDAHLVVLAHTEAAGEWSVLWQVPVEETRVAEVKAFLLQLYRSEVSSPTITYDQTWTPCKRLASVLEQAPEETGGPADGA